MANSIHILGANPSSLLLAACLTQKGFQTTVFQSVESSKLPYGITLFPPIIKELRELGIMNEIQENSTSIKRYKITDKDLRSRYEADTFQSSAFSKQSLLGIQSNLFEQIIRQKFSFNIETVGQVTAIQQTESNIKIKVNSTDYTSDYLIVTDPEFRTLTPIKSGAVETKTATYRGYCSIPFAEIHENSIIETATAKHYFRLIPAADGNKFWTVKIPAKQAATAPNLVRDRLLKEFEGFYPNVTDVIYATKSSDIEHVKTPTVNMPAQTYVGRTLLFGNAVHGDRFALSTEVSIDMMDVFKLMESISEVGIDASFEHFFKKQKFTQSKMLQTEKEWSEKVRPSSFDMFRAKKSLQQSLDTFA